jgi:hypothetical protein
MSPNVTSEKWSWRLDSNHRPHGQEIIDAIPATSCNHRDPRKHQIMLG